MMGFLSIVVMFIGIAFISISALGIKKSLKIELDYVVTIIAGLLMIFMGLLFL
jgi:sulfite exporter TauE/SafE